MRSLRYLLPLSLILVLPAISTTQEKKPGREDSLRVKVLTDSIMQREQERRNTFKLIPKFHADKDSAGFQLIPPHVDSYNIIVEPGHNDSTKRKAPADSLRSPR
jgi:hypothetical protein